MNMTTNKYVDTGGLHCPACGKKTAEAQGSVEFTGDSTNGYQDVRCTSCGANWQDQFELTGYINLELDEEIED